MHFRATKILTQNVNRIGLIIANRMQSAAVTIVSKATKRIGGRVFASQNEQPLSEAHQNTEKIKTKMEQRSTTVISTKKIFLKNDLLHALHGKIHCRIISIIFPIDMSLRQN